MSKTCAIVLLCLIFLLIPSEYRVSASEHSSSEKKVDHASTLEEKVLSVEAHYRQITDLSARVSQKNHLKTLGKTQIYDGMLWIKIPGKLRLEYTNGQLILINGKDALFYSKKSEQVIKKSFLDFAQMNIPVAFLLGAGHIRDDFEMVQADPKSPHTFGLLPKKAGAAMKKLDIQAEESGRIRLMTIVDHLGNVTEISFSDIQEATGIGDNLFLFKIPKGVEIIEQ